MSHLIRILEGNEFLDDENAANILLDRALAIRNNRLEYCRDIRAKQQVWFMSSLIFLHKCVLNYFLFFLKMLLSDHYTDMLIFRNSFEDASIYPILYLHSVPFFTSETAFKDTVEFLKKSKSKFEYVGIEGTHYFHMTNPEKTANLIKDFFKRNLNSNATKIISKL